MAFPAIEATAKSNTGGGTTHAVDLPANIQVGELLIVLFCCDDDETITWPEGWTEIFNKKHTLTPTLAVAWRIADGEEGASISVGTPDSAECTAHIAMRISGHDSGQAPEASTGFEGTTDSPDPDSLTPTGGAKDYLWMAVEGNDDGRTYPSAYPTNYADNQDYSNYDASTGATVGMATRELNSISGNPGVFTLTSSEYCLACTIAVHPVAAAGVAPTGVLDGPLVGPLGGPI